MIDEDDWHDRDEHERDDCFEYDERGPGCLFPGECCMPGPHDKRECHTAQMIRDYNYRMQRGLPT